MENDALVANAANNICRRFDGSHSRQQRYEENDE
jgi:hypothetical protein